jgi:DNA-binding NarL/FixJ family response regulator
VFLLDDHEIFRRGLRDLLEADLDVAFGFEACREIRSRHPRTACLILTSFADDEALFQAIMAGRRGMSSSRSAPWTSSRRCGGSGPVRTCSILG